MDSTNTSRRALLGAGQVALAGGVVAAAAAAFEPARAYAQAAGDSLLRTVLDRGHLLVGTGSTNAPWHFEDEKGELVGMDIAMARILAKGLFDDESKVEFVREDPAARIPNIATGKVDVVIQFMTVNPLRAQQVAFSRPYYLNGVALLTKPDSKRKTYDALTQGGADTDASALQNVDADELVHNALPQAQVLQIDTQPNVIQALEARRVDAAAVDLSTVWWLVKRQPDKYAEAKYSWNSMLYAAALRQSDLDWLRFVNTAFDVAMFGHQNEIFDKAVADFFGLKPPVREFGLPKF